MKRLACKPRKPLLYWYALPLMLALAQAIVAWMLKLPGFSDDWGLNSLLQLLWLIAVGVISVTALADYLSGRKQPNITFVRHSKEILALHRWSTVTLKISADGLTKPLTLEIKELADPCLEIDKTRLQVQLKPLHHTEVSYQIRPNRRGDAYVEGLQILIPSDFGWWHTVWQIELSTKLKVYPDFQAISGYRLLAQDNHLSQIGIKRKPRRGEGMEFHQLREYQRGDSSRQIDWKATARRQKLISRDYQDERDQQIIVMLDNGRRMRSEDQQLGHLDHSVNAMSLLSHIALKQGDAVGLMTFGSENRWLPCSKGSSQINAILNHVYDLQPGTHATDHSAAAQKLVQLQRKRSLVILITNTRDEDIDDLLPAIKLISKHHLILLANIREPILQKTLDEPVTTAEQAYRFCGTVDYLNRRQSVNRLLQDNGVFVLDCDPAELALAVCNSYLEIKRSGYL